MNRTGFQRFLYVLRGAKGRRQLGVGQHGKKFIARIPNGQTLIGQVFVDDLGHARNHLIACGVAVAVIPLLEVVEVNKKQTQRGRLVLQ